jgi:nucleoside-diphosphate-sugar epimerase
MPITVDEENVRLSFVDSLSVAGQIVKIIALAEVPSQAYNLCSRENPTLKEFIEAVVSAT